MLRFCSPLFYFFSLAAIFILPLAVTHWGSTRVRRENSSAFDSNARVLIVLFIAAIESIGLWFIYIFFHGVGC